MIQISATSFNSKCRSFSCTQSQSSAKAGACLVEEQKWAFQNHHLPHLHIKYERLFLSKSTIISIVLGSFIIVQTGTFKIRSFQLAPCIVLVPQFSHFIALMTFL